LARFLAAIRGAVALFAVLSAVTAFARTAEVCTGPGRGVGCFTIDTSFIGVRPFGDYVVARRGPLLVDVDKRRAELAADPYQAGLYCAVNPAAAVAAHGLPTIAFDSATVRLFETRVITPAVRRVREYAVVAFDGLRNSDGTSYPKFGLTFNRQQNDPVLRLEFFPSNDPNLRGIPALSRDVYLNVDTASGANRFEGLDDLEPTLRRMLLAIAYRLPDVFAGIATVQVQPGAVDPLWDLAGLVTAGATFSRVGFATPQPVLPPVVTLNCDAATCREAVALNEYRDLMIRYGADYVATANPVVTEAILANLKGWAQANALSTFAGIVVGAQGQPDFRQKYELAWILVPIVHTWSLVRNDPMVTPADRTLVENWLGRVVGYSTEGFGGPGGGEDPFNVGYLMRGLKMQWGILTGNDATVAEGMEKVLMGLHQMRQDGSFPREVARGACALKYQDTMLLNLMFLAELAAMQGYDAYSLSVDGKTLHTAVKFLLDAVDDPSVVLPYAVQDPTNCLNEPPLPTIGLSTVVEVPPGGLNYTAWLEPYIARFPDHPNSLRLRNLLKGGLEPNRPIFHPHSGGNTTCFSANAKIGPIVPVGSPANYQGLWWNPGESGWGINFSHQGDTIFATWFTYDAAGDGWWLSMTANKVADRTYAGALIETAGPPFSAVPFDRTKVTRAEVGNGTLAFSDESRGTFSYSVKGVQQTKSIVRQVFGTLPTCTYGATPDFAAARNYQDLWWVADGAESGWGINLTHQGDTIFATWFTYDADGSPLWLSVTAGKVAAGVYSGDLIRTRGPAFNATPFDPGRVTRSVVGTGTFAFTTGNAAGFAYTVNSKSQTKAITRQVFAPPGTVCQ